MVIINPYLNFDGQAEEAFNFYKSIFGGEFTMVKKVGESPGTENLTDNEKERIMHIALPIGPNTILMASDILPSFGHQLVKGNTTHLCLHPDSREEAKRLFDGLSEGGTIEMPMEDMFWGDYFGSFKDKYAIFWMISFSQK
ncbi:VOC family protein [Pedobacter metabolipauper]|uniref:PhnB protein n=1 Tax=Pedobacter metabolipauper TaxID=425513 RepID=A0A4R6SYZ0_9SPHI|nr:VOC family protein [Pedobacter metabolipauper]TDQ11277.1 PhnB protein [Pedobacter metabolipauper]